MLKYKSRANKSIFNKLTNKIFWEEYYQKNDEKNKNKFRDMTLLNNEGVFWAKEYFKEHFRTLTNLRKKKVWCMKKIDSDPIYLKVIIRRGVWKNYFTESQQSKVLNKLSKNGIDNNGFTFE